MGTQSQSVSSSVMSDDSCAIAHMALLVLLRVRHPVILNRVEQVIVLDRVASAGLIIAHLAPESSM